MEEERSVNGGDIDSHLAGQYDFRGQAPFAGFVTHSFGVPFA